MRTLILLIVMLFPLCVQAQEDLSVQTLCRNLADYRQGAGVEYVPGAEDVVPADIGGPRRVSADIIEIPVTVQLAEMFPTVTIPTDIELEPDYGVMEIHSNGDVTYRGFDVTSEAQVVCGEDVSITESADGHEAHEPLEFEPEEQQEPENAKPSQSPDTEDE